VKPYILLAVVAAIVVGVVLALKSTLAPAKFDSRSAGVTGPLAVGAVSKAAERIMVWREPRGSISREDRQALLAGILESGDGFRVLNHVPADVLWVEIEGLDGDLRGWVRSPPDEPVHATRIR
jgi:hypothetical protein